MPDDFKCPKCDAAMQEGFTIDRGHMNMTRVDAWFPGNPRDSLLRGPATFEQQAASISIITLRCPTCGYLESYAPPKQNS